MNSLIASFEDLKTEVKFIQEFTEIPTDGEMADAIEKGNMLVNYISRTGKMLADAKYHLNAKRNSETMTIIETILKKEHLSAKVQNSLIDCICRDEQYLVDWIERLNRTCTHQMEWCRTIVSKNKEEMKLAGTASREFGDAKF